MHAFLQVEERVIPVKDLLEADDLYRNCRCCHPNWCCNLSRRKVENLTSFFLLFGLISGCRDIAFAGLSTAQEKEHCLMALCGFQKGSIENKMGWACAPKFTTFQMEKMKNLNMKIIH